MKSENWIKEQIAVAEKQLEETPDKMVQVTARFLVMLHIDILTAILDKPIAGDE